jgi:hypothetical protein
VPPFLLLPARGKGVDDTALWKVVIEPRMDAREGRRSSQHI